MPRLEQLERRDLFTAAVSIVVPADGATVAGRVEVEGDVSGMDNQVTVNFYVDSILQSLTSTVQNTYSLAWQSEAFARGPHILSVWAHDASGHSATASSTVFARGWFNVLDYGARGNGSADDTNAIQAAIDAAHRAGGGTVDFPVGTYLVNPRLHTLALYSNLELVGSGRDSIIKVANGTGNYGTIFSNSGEISNLTLRNFRIDQNPYGNWNVDINYFANYQNILQLKVGHNVTLQGMEFDEDGVQGVVLTGPNANGVIINECYFYFVRARQAQYVPIVDGLAMLYDNSSIYVDGANQVIRYNVLTSPVGEQAFTAVELHGGPSILVEYNLITGFHTSVIVLDTIPQYPHADGYFTVQGNEFLQTSAGVLLSANTGQTLRYGSVSNNYITFRDPNFDPHYYSPYTGQVLNDYQRDPTGILFWFSINDGSAGNFDQIQIFDNTIDFGNLRPAWDRSHGPTVSGCGINLAPWGYATNIVVQGNTVINSPAIGINLGNSASRGLLQHVWVEDNTIINAVWESLVLDVAPMNDVQVTGNAIQDTGSTAPWGLYAVWAHPLSANLVIVGNNEVSSIGSLLSDIAPDLIQAPFPAGWSDGDIGWPGLTGSASHVASTGTWTVRGGGSDIWYSFDQFHFASESYTGNGSVVARVIALQNTDPWAKAGVMFRDGTAAGAMFADVVLTPGNGVSFQWRNATGGNAASVQVGGITGPVWVKLTRSGNNFSAFYSVGGVTWIPIGTTQTINMATTAAVGLAVTSHNNSALATAAFDNVSIGALPGGWSDGDIGSPGLAGSTSYSGSTGTWTLRGGGSDIWNTFDQFHFANQSLSGNGSLVARVTALDNTDPWAKAGVMFRNGAAAGAMFADVVLTPGNGVSFQWRNTTGGNADSVQVGGITGPVWVKLTRSGNNFSGFYSVDGVTWIQIGTTQTINMAATAAVGLAVTSHNNSALANATFDSVNVSALPAGWTNGDIGSPGQAGSASYAASTGTWTLRGGGSDIWNTSDQFHFASRNYTGNGSVIAEVTGLTNTDPWAKAGVMFRDGTAAGAMFADVVLTPGNGVSFQWRNATGGSADSVQVSGITGTVWVKLTRSGNNFSAFYSLDGVNWIQIGTTQTINMRSTARVGLAVTAHNNSTLTTATFNGVTVG
jgi:hypothetical protein